MYFNSHLLPGPGRLLALCAAVRKSGQGRSDRLLLVSPPRAQWSPSPTLSSSGPGLPAEAHQGKVGTLGIDAWLLWFLWFVVSDACCRRALYISTRAHELIAQRAPGHLGVRLPATPAPPGPRQLSAVSHRGASPRCPGTTTHMTAPAENLMFSAQGAHPNCWHLSLHVHSSEQRNQGLPLRHNRDVDHVKNCNCGTTTVFYTVTITSTFRCSAETPVFCSVWTRTPVLHRHKLLHDAADPLLRKKLRDFHNLFLN